MINITSNTARTLYQAEFERNMTVLENVHIRELKPVLNRQYMNTAKFVEQGILDDIDYAVDKESDREVRLLKRHYTRVATVFSALAYKLIEEGGYLTVGQLRTPKEEFWRALRYYIRKYGAEKIKDIDKKTKKALKRVILKGKEEGESHRDIAKRIRKAGRITTPRRAITIAKTETHSAATYSVKESVKSTRLEMEREWVSSRDDRTRSRIRKDRFEHYLKFPAGPDGERIGMDDVYKKTGEHLKYPGDPDGSAGNIIACRCVELFFTKKIMKGAITA